MDSKESSRTILIAFESNRVVKLCISASAGGGEEGITVPAGLGSKKAADSATEISKQLCWSRGT